MIIIENKNIKDYNSFGISVNAKLFAELKSESDFKEINKLKNKLPLPFLILGGGNNILFINDFKGTILKVSNQGIRIVSENETELIVEVKAGVDWNDFVEFTLTRNLYGVENLIDIPGQTGSAPIQNIGAYGTEAGESIVSVRYFDIEKGVFTTLTHDECDFGYRQSIFKNKLKNKVIIESVEFKLLKNGKLKTHYGNIDKMILPSSKPIDIARIISQIRAEKLPDPKVTGNAGSFFKNPVVSKEKHNALKNKFPEMVSYKLPKDRYKIAAGWLIDKAGLKGLIMGNAGVHHKQALVLVNHTGKATGHEIVELAEYIIGVIKDKFNIILEPEVNFVT